METSFIIFKSDASECGAALAGTRADLIMAMDDLEFALEKAESKHGAVLKETEKMRGEYEQRMEEREQEGRQAMMRLQALLEAEKSKSENDRKTHNEAIR